MTGPRSGAGRPAGAGASPAGSSSAPGCPASSLAPTSSSMGLLADQRSSRPSPAPARTQMTITMAASAAKEPVTRSCAYGGRENPTAVSHPMTPRRIAATGSATKDHAVTTAAAATSTPVAVNRPWRAAATAPIRKSAAKPVTNAKCAAIPRRVEPFISLTVERPAGPENKDLDGSLTRRSAVLTRPLRPRRTAALSVGGGGRSTRHSRAGPATGHGFRGLRTEGRTIGPAQGGWPAGANPGKRLAGELRVLGQAAPARPPHGQRGTAPPAPVESHRSGRAVAGRHILLRLRHGGNADRTAPRVRHRRVRAHPSDDRCDLVRHGPGGALLSRGCD